MSKGKKNTQTAGVEDTPADNPDQIEIEVTQETLDLNPELSDEGVEVGEIISVDAEDHEPKQYVVAQSFRDKEKPNEYVIFQEGEDIDFEGERLEYLIENGFVKEKQA